MIILSVSSDIGHDLALRYYRAGAKVIGSFRQRDTISDLFRLKGMTLLPCDLNDSESIRNFGLAIRNMGVKWDTFVSSVASQLPIGKFFSCDFDQWEESILTNFTRQLKSLHMLYPFRAEPMANAIFFAGPGTNNAAPYYSAMCVSKIALIKMCELLDGEYENLNIFTIGPGWVQTKIHQQTLDHPEAAGLHFQKVKQFVESKDGTPLLKIFEQIEWLIGQGRQIASGRNFSTVFDLWGEDSLKSALSQDPQMYKLRRFRNEWK